jgi:hypothetical protein
VVVALMVFFMLTCAGATLLLDAWLRRSRRRDLAERLRPFQPSSLAE